MTIIEEAEETYVIIEENDTVLVRTRESVAISSELAGAFYSKVKVVSEGFGHVSTTLDPNWEGQLLISLNNPTNRKLKFSIEKKVYGKIIYNSFVTLEFMYMNVPTEMKSDNLPGRLDILDATITRNISKFKRDKIDNLKEIVTELHKQEEKTIDNLTMEFLNEPEREEWRNISIIQDETAYIRRKEEFLKKKREKYLRLLQTEFDKNARESLNIINYYIEQKMKYLPIRYRIWNVFIYYKWEWILSITLLVFIIVKICFWFIDIDIFEIINIIWQCVSEILVLGVAIYPIIRENKKKK